MIIIIDGTGDYGRDSYAKAMAGGFCKKVQFLAGRPSQSSEKAKGAVLYHRGPGLAGTETYAIADEMLSKVPRRWDPKEDMYLVGHSRGGAAVIYAAQELEKRGISVRAMVLFDAVDRVLVTNKALLNTVALGMALGPIPAILSFVTDPGAPDVSTIPLNVKNCYHARRDARAATGIVTYYEQYVTSAKQNRQKVDPKNKAMVAAADLEVERAVQLDTQMKVRMRAVNKLGDGSIDFGNCGTSFCSIGYKEEFFLGSHGAMGGSPRVSDDDPDLKEINDWKAAKLANPASESKTWDFPRGKPSQPGSMPSVSQLLLDPDRAAMASVWSWMSGNMTREGLI